MRRQLPQRLQEYNVAIEESVAYFDSNPDISIIHQLEDLGESISDSRDYAPILSRQDNLIRKPNRKRSTLEEMQMKSISPKSKFRHQYAHQEAEKQIQKLIGERTKAKIQLRERQKSGWIAPISPRHYDKVTDSQTLTRRNPYIDRPFIETHHKDKDNFAIKAKADYNRSSIIKNKQIIMQILMNNCMSCGQRICEVFRDTLVCCNPKCRNEKTYDPVKTFPLMGMLYDMEIPSSSLDDLADLMKKIRQQLEKIEQWRKQLLNLQFQVQQILDTRRQHDRETRIQIRDFISALNSVKKSKNQVAELEDLHLNLSNIRLSKTYEQFLRWSRLQVKNFQNCKPICESLEKCKPLCLKDVQPKIFKQMADVCNNFRNTPVKVNVSSTIFHNFAGKISKLIVCIDGSIELKQNCFLLVEEIEELVVEFQSKKTSRQLREILHILPSAEKLEMQFDFKIHSHVSSEAFPMLSKFIEKGRDQVKLTFINARPQFIQDIMVMSRCIGEKKRVFIDIRMNPYVGVQQIPENLRKNEWGAMVIKNLLRNVGSQVTHINLNLPIFVRKSEISEFIINNEFPNLIEWDLRTLTPENSLNEDRIQNDGESMENLLQEIIKKKMIMLGLLVSEKKKKEDKLQVYDEVKAAIYHMLA